MSFLSALMPAASGFLGGGPIGAALGFAGGLFGSGKGQENRSVLRNLEPGEMEIWSNVLKGMKDSGTGAYDPKIFDALYNPLARDIELQYGKTAARSKRALASTGTGPAGIVNSQMADITKSKADAMGKARSDATMTATNVTSQNRASLGSWYNSILGGRQVGGGMDVSYPSDNMFSAMGLGMDGLMNKDSYWNKSGTGMKVNDWFANMLGGKKKRLSGSDDLATA